MTVDFSLSPPLLSLGPKVIAGSRSLSQHAPQTAQIYQICHFRVSHRLGFLLLMESDSWSRFSRRHQSTLQSRFDTYLGFEDYEGRDEDPNAEFICPFCAEYFDIVELCCHIDEEHPVEAKNGVCPVCAARVGVDMVNHITTQHGKFFKMQRRRLRRGLSGSHSRQSLLRKELRDGSLRSNFGGSQYAVSPANAAADPLLSSFITNFPLVDPSGGEESKSLDDGNMINEASKEKAKESIEPALSDKDQEERTRRSEFVQGLLLSTIFDDVLLS